MRFQGNIRTDVFFVIPDYSRCFVFVCHGDDVLELLTNRDDLRFFLSNPMPTNCVGDVFLFLGGIFTQLSQIS